MLVTGATGFLGMALTKRLARDSRYTPRAAVRSDSHDYDPGFSSIKVGDMTADTEVVGASG